MARWSITNDANGAPNRFWVWDSSNDKFSHTDLQRNWDTLDAIIGGSSTWPNTRGPGGGIFAEIESVSSDLCPLGSVIAWWRPSISVSLPSGWVPCDGRTLTPASHSYGSSNLTIPDLRNRFILGSLAPDGAGYPGDGVAGVNADTSASAPSINGAGGSNAPNAHTHTVPHHYHIHAHWHEFNAQTGDGTGTPNVSGGSATTNAAKWAHTHAVDDMTSSARPVGSARGAQVLQEHTSLPVVNGSGNNAIDVTDINNPIGGANVDPTHPNSSGLQNAPLITTNASSSDTRPRYIGLLYIVKVKRNATS